MLEIGDEDVEGISIRDDTTHSWKRRKGQWDIGRNIQEDWVLRFTYIQKGPPKNKNESSLELRCNVCS